MITVQRVCHSPSVRAHTSETLLHHATQPQKANCQTPYKHAPPALHALPAFNSGVCATFSQQTFFADFGLWGLPIWSNLTIKVPSVFGWRRAFILKIRYFFTTFHHIFCKLPVDQHPNTLTMIWEAFPVTFPANRVTFQQFPYIFFSSLFRKTLFSLQLHSLDLEVEAFGTKSFGSYFEWLNSFFTQLYWILLWSLIWI